MWHHLFDGRNLPVGGRRVFADSGCFGNQPIVQQGMSNIVPKTGHERRDMSQHVPKRPAWANTAQHRPTWAKWHTPTLANTQTKTPNTCQNGQHRQKWRVSNNIGGATWASKQARAVKRQIQPKLNDFPTIHQLAHSNANYSHSQDSGRSRPQPEKNTHGPCKHSKPGHICAIAAWCEAGHSLFSLAGRAPAQ